MCGLFPRIPVLMSLFFFWGGGGGGGGVKKRSYEVGRLRLAIKLS